MSEVEPARVTWPEVNARRLERHGVGATSPKRDPADGVAAMCGAHAQVLSAAELSVGIRLPSASRTDVRHALWTEHSLVKTFGPRGTVHLLATRDLPMWTGALSAVPRPRSPFPDAVRMTPAQTDKVVEAIGVALADAELTVDELTRAVIDGAGPWAGDLVMPAFQTMWPRWRQAVDVVANRGVLCFGANRGRNVTYTSPTRWLPGFAPEPGATALPELVRRYLDAYGPATPAHFAKWLSVSPAWAARLFESMTDNLRWVELDGVVAAEATGEASMSAEVPRGLRLLPYFDAFVVGGQPRELLFPGRAAERALSPSGQAGNFPVVLVDGVVAGVWHQRRSGRKLDITVEPFGRLTRTRRAELDEQVERVGQILEASPSLTIGTIAVGGHA
jgi:hypothetical protein